jgi:hypothetical protein
MIERLLLPDWARTAEECVHTSGRCSFNGFEYGGKTIGPAVWALQWSQQQVNMGSGMTTVA